MPGQTINDYFQEGRQAVGNYLYGNGVRLKSNQPTYWEDSWNNAAWQYALAAYEKDNNIELWNMMNEYNSPASQMQRFKEAGLNPMLAYTQGTPGNANSAVQYNRPNAQLTPQADKLRKMEAASQMIGTVSNLVQNVFGMFDSSLDLQLKRNQVDFSNYERANAWHNLSGFGYGRTAQTGQKVPSFALEALNPFSDYFDLSTFNAYSKLGKLPEYFNDWYFGIPKKDYTEARTKYQEFYNEKLLPLFEKYQEGKIDLQNYEKELEEYQKGAREMIPPELRGILEPVFQWLSPFIKFIFKSSRGSFNHSVK